MIRECFHCHQFVISRTCCGYCFKKLSSCANPRVGFLENSGILASSLYIWRPNESSMLNAFIKHQKERSSERLLKQLIERTLSFEMKSRLHETEALIPVPPKVPGQQDHAFRIAKVLSELMGKPIVMPLRSKSASPQKRLSKTDRKAIAFEKIPVNFANHHRLTLVDDVITTGQTMNAMVAALEGVQKFHLFSLAQRVLIDPTRDKC